MKKWIRITKRNIGRRKVGDVYHAQRSEARTLIAVGLAEECEDPNAKKPATKAAKKKRRAHKRRDVKPAERVVMTPEGSDDE